MVPNWRPPYGASSGSVEAAAAKVGFTKKWLWDVDSLDWKYRSDTDKIVDQVEKGLRGCGKQTCDILFHDKDTTVDALQVIMPRLKLEGYKFVNFP
jgi:peptidoglycan/xylan/chitin deacetylase (PgdA/CDA1 family)